MVLHPHDDSSTEQDALAPSNSDSVWERQRLARESKALWFWRSTTVTELCNEALTRPPLEWIAAEIIPSGPFVHLWTGLPGAGKSYAAQSLALSLALGELCWGHFAALRRAPVLYVDLEGNRSLSCLRFPPLVRGLDSVEVQACHVIDGIDSMNVLAGDLGTVADKLHEIEDREGAKVDLVVFDSLSKMHQEDENSAKMASVMAAIREFGEAEQVGQLLIHHNRKGGQYPGTAVESARGHTSIAASVDTHLVFAREGGIVRVVQGKNRLMPEIEPFRLRIDGDHGGGLVRVVFVEEGPPAAGAAVRAREFAVGHIEEHGWVPKAQLVAEAERRGIAKRTLEAELRRLLPERRIMREMRGKEAWFGPVAVEPG